MANFSFDEASGVDVGSLADPLATLLGLTPRFTVTCRKVSVPGCPLQVYWRRVKDAWCSVVVELEGQANYGPYSITLDDAASVGAAPVKVPIPMHFWYSRWRYDFQPWPYRLIPELLLPFPGIVTTGESAGAILRQLTSGQALATWQFNLILDVFH